MDILEYIAKQKKPFVEVIEGEQGIGIRFWGAYDLYYELNKKNGRDVLRDRYDFGLFMPADWLIELCRMLRRQGMRADNVSFDVVHRQAQWSDNNDNYHRDAIKGKYFLFCYGNGETEAPLYTAREARKIVFGYAHEHSTSMAKVRQEVKELNYKNVRNYDIHRIWYYKKNNLPVYSKTLKKEMSVEKWLKNKKAVEQDLQNQIKRDLEIGTQPGERELYDTSTLLLRGRKKRWH